MAAATRPLPGQVQLQLAHVGHVDTADGRLEVCCQRLVLSDLVQPDDIVRLLLFTPAGQLVASYPISWADTALWCEGGKVYFPRMIFVAGIPPDEALANTRSGEDEGLESLLGNVLDFSRGISRVTLRRERRYGSSGDLADTTPPNPNGTPGAAPDAPALISVGQPWAAAARATLASGCSFANLSGLEWGWPAPQGFLIELPGGAALYVFRDVNAPRVDGIQWVEHAREAKLNRRYRHLDRFDLRSIPTTRPSP